MLWSIKQLQFHFYPGSRHLGVEDGGGNTMFCFCTDVSLLLHVLSAAMQLASTFSGTPLSVFIHSCPLPSYPSYSSPSPAPSLAFLSSLDPPLDAYHASVCTHPTPTRHCWSFSLQFKLTLSSLPSSKLTLNNSF